MPHFQIKRWDTDAVIYEGEAETLMDLVNTAVKGMVSLYRADMRVAYMQGADMRGAYMRGAKFGKGEILRIRVFSGLYKYTIYAYILRDGATPCVKMGCLDFTLSEWEEKGGILKSNLGEFPDDGGIESMRRARAFNYAVVEALAMKAEIEAKK